MTWRRDGIAVFCRVPGWIAGAVTAAAMIAGCGSSVASSSLSSDSPSPGRQSPSGSPARAATPSPTARPSSSAWSASVCKAKDLKLSERYGGAGAGQHFTIYVVTNDGTAPCAVGSRPLLQETLASGQEQPVLNKGKGQKPGSWAIVIQPGQQASFWADFGSCYNPSLEGEARKPHQLEIIFTGPSGPELVQSQAGAAPCSQQDVAVSPVQNGIVSTG